LQRIEAGDANNTALAVDLIEIIDTSDRVEEEAIIPPYEEIPMPQKAEFKFPPIWDRIARTSKKINNELVFKWINHRVLFRQRWGYKRGKQNPEAFFGESIYRKMEASSLNPQNGYKAMSTMKISMTRKLIST
jgi:5-methyltetrahydrofolate--homocysteine methyltransferase